MELDYSVCVVLQGVMLVLEKREMPKTIDSMKSIVDELKIDCQNKCKGSEKEAVYEDLVNTEKFLNTCKNEKIDYNKIKKIVDETVSPSDCLTHV